MARLPVVGADDNQFGALLNEYLRVSHTLEGLLKDTALQQSPLISSLIPQNEGEQVVRGPSGLASVIFRTNAAAYDSPQAALENAADAGQSVYFPPQTYILDTGLAPTDKMAIQLHANSEFYQTTKYRPVFDILDADDVVIDGEGALLIWNGSRAYTGGGATLRGDDPYNYGAAIWSNGNRTRVGNLRVHGFTAAVYLSAWNGSTLGDFEHEDCEVHDLKVEDVDFGVLAGGQVALTLRNISGQYSLQIGSGNPSHLIYVTKTGLNKGIDVDGAKARDGSGGVAFQFKGIRGGKAINLIANDCAGLLAIDDSQDFDAVATSHDDLGGGENGSLQFVDDNVERCKVDVSIHAANTTTGFRVAAIDGTDNTIDISGRTKQTTTIDAYAVVVRGDRNTTTFAMANTADDGSDLATGRRGVGLIEGSQHTLHIAQARNFKGAFDTSAGVENCKVTLDARRVVPIGSGALVPLSNISEARLSFTRDGELDVLVSGAGQTIRVDATRYARAIVTASTADAFAISSPYGPVPVGTQLTYLIRNRSGGLMGTLTWPGHVIRTAALGGTDWSNPGSNLDKTIMFEFDGVRWKETWRSV